MESIGSITKLAQKAIATIVTETRAVDYRGRSYGCKLVKNASSKDLRSYLVDLKKASPSNKKIKKRGVEFPLLIFLGCIIN